MSDSESNSNYKSKQNNNPNLLYVIYCFPKDNITNNISNNIIINKWNFISCSTDYNERKAYLYINPESENSTHLWNEQYKNQPNVYNNPYLNNILYTNNENSFDIYSKEYLGFNYILEEPTITLSEDYKYYDELNNMSVQFVDFGKITSDLVFNVPNS